MIFKCEKMRRGYHGLIFALIVLCFLIELMTQNVCAYPYRNDWTEKNTVQISNISSDSNRNELRSNLDSRQRFKRDSLIYEDIDISNISIKILSRNKQGSLQKERMQSDGKIVFPGEARQVPVCKGLTYCEKVDSYPEEIVSKAIQRNESLRYLAGVDVISDVVQRIDVTDDVPLCVSVEQLIFPQSAENKDSEWKFIANQENYKQGVRIEKCSKESNSCSVIGGLAAGYKTSCRQKYIYRQLTAVLQDGSLAPDRFRFPSSCCCHVSFNGNPLTRIGVNLMEQRSEVTPIKSRRRK